MYYRSRTQEHTISLQYLPFRAWSWEFVRLDVSLYNVYIINQFQTTFGEGGGKLLDFCPNYVQEFGLRTEKCVNKTCDWSAPFLTEAIYSAQQYVCCLFWECSRLLCCQLCNTRDAATNYIRRWGGATSTFHPLLLMSPDGKNNNTKMVSSFFFLSCLHASKSIFLPFVTRQLWNAIQ